MPDKREPIGGIVLCGGHSRRMGQSKAWLPFGSETLVERMTRLLRDVVSPIVVVAAEGQSLPRFDSDVRIVRDEIESIGPLGGLCAGLSALCSECNAVFATGCDTPFLQPAVIRLLIDALDDHDLVIPREGRYYHPLTAVYRTRLEHNIRQLIQQQRYRPVFLIETANARQIDVSELRAVDPELQSLRNLNTQSDYQTALEEAGFARHEP